jgi:hypothetical protein
MVRCLFFLYKQIIWKLPFTCWWYCLNAVKLWNLCVSNLHDQKWIDEFSILDLVAQFMVNLFIYFKVFNCKFACSVNNISQWELSLELWSLCDQNTYRDNCYSIKMYWWFSYFHIVYNFLKHQMQFTLQQMCYVVLLHFETKVLFYMPLFLSFECGFIFLSM